MTFSGVRLQGASYKELQNEKVQTCFARSLVVRGRGRYLEMRNACLGTHISEPILEVGEHYSPKKDVKILR